MIKIHCDVLDQLDACAEQVIQACCGKTIWLFEGEMGAGKTTLISAISARMGVADRVSSPTFGLVNEYHDLGGNVYYHFDFYRIDSEQEALDIGVYEYFDSGSYCWIEWGSKISSLLPEDCAVIEIEAYADGRREITVR